MWFTRLKEMEIDVRIYSVVLTLRKDVTLDQASVDGDAVRE